MLFRSVATASSSTSLYEHSSEPRQYSRLRARKTARSSSHSSASDANSGFPRSEAFSERPSYRQYYWLMVARVAKYLLTVLGDDDDDNDVDDELRENSPEETPSNDIILTERVVNGAGKGDGMKRGKKSQ